MSVNIKLNPYFIIEKWNEMVLDDTISQYPSSAPDISTFSAYISSFIEDDIISGTDLKAPIKHGHLMKYVSYAINTISSDSWCKDCCDQTFQSYDHIKQKIWDMHIFTNEQLMYINQIIGMPCNPSITNVDDFIPILSQLETAVILDKSMTRNDKNPILLLIEVSKYSRSYWTAQVTNISSPWNVYFTPLTPAEYLRPLWLSGIFGAILLLEKAISDAIDIDTGDCLNISEIALVGASVTSASYIFYK